MRLFILTFSISLFIAFVGCSSNTKTATGSTVSKKEPPLTDYQSVVNTAAQDVCTCLKPLEDIQTKLEKGEIEMQVYAEKMQSLTASLQTCTEKMTEATQNNNNMRVDVISKMKDICPKIAGVIVSVQ